MFFSWIKGGFIKNIQLDIAGFLAILGEGSVTANLQVSTLSKLIFVPRLVPAPQVFLRPTRSTQLERSAGNVTGVHSGNDKDYVNYIGHIVLDAEDMPEYSVRCVQIEKNKNHKDGKVKARTKGPLSLLVLLGAAESIAIFGVAIKKRDGMALLAVLLLSCLSTLAGLSNWWQLSLPKRKHPKMRNRENKNKPTSRPTNPPKGDVVIRYPNGSFLVVECEENVARELYFAPENVFYLIESPWVYRLMSLAGTLMLMMGVITLGNAETVSQLVFAGSYMLLNAAYWIVAALPARAHWDLSAFTIKKQRFEKHYEDLTYKHDDGDDDYEYDDNEDIAEKERKKVKKMKAAADKTFTDLNPTFTHAMWKAIVATKSIAWVKKNDALPETPVWNDWLQDALIRSRVGEVTEATMDKCPYPVKSFSVPDWEPLGHFYKLLEKYNRDSAILAEREKGDNEVDGVDDPNGPASRRTTDLEQPQDQPFIPTGPRRAGTFNLED